MNPELKYCSRCCMPETTDGIEFDEFGVCKACIASEEKMKIDWVKKEKELKSILLNAKKKSGNNYDCMVPISGGKDSAFQLHILTRIYGIKPLAVTFNHNWYSKVGWENLWNVLEKLDVDHVMYTPKRSLVNRLARKSLTMIGDSCWHCHAGVHAFPLTIATKFNIKLLVLGESPAEFSGRDTFGKQKFKDGKASILCKTALGSHGKDSINSVSKDNIEKQEMVLFKAPTPAELDKADVRFIYLGDFLFWDHERQMNLLVKEYGWKEDDVEGNFKRYKSVECRMPGVHDYSKFIKRGYGRSTDFVSQDVRAGLMTREEAFKIAKKYDSKRPKALDYYLKITGYSEDEFISILKDLGKDLRKGKAKKVP